jgi:hypothetical protein
MKEDQKFIDLIPPSSFAQEAKPKRPFLERRINFFGKFKNRFSFPFKTSVFSNFLRKLLTIIFLFAILFISFYYLSSQKAEIKIWPKLETIKLEKEIDFQRDANLELANLKAPFVVLEKDETKTQKFQASLVNEERRAEGVIKVYNFYSTAPIVLKEQTRFLSEKNKVFRATEKIVIPARQKEGKETIPGIVEVKVVAAEPGPDYNIPPSKFSIPGLVGTPLYTMVYGESKESMTGGFSAKVNQVLAEDLTKAKEAIKSNLEEELIRKFKEDYKDKFVIVENSLRTEVVAESASAKVGDKVSEFDYSLKLKAKIFAVDRDSAFKMAKFLIGEELKTSQKNILENRLKVAFKKIKEETEENNFKALIKIEGKLMDPVDLKVLKTALAGKSRTESLFFLKDKYENAEIQLSPFWLKRIPDNLEKIDLKLMLD